MDYDYIITQEGYRREDLKKEDQITLKWLDVLAEEIDAIKENIADYDDDMSDEESIIGKLKKEVVDWTLDFAKEYLEDHIKEIQVCLAEGEED